jgi:hypothetical protein
MTIRYANGRILEAVVLSRMETTMRVATPGCDDSLELNEIHGVWVTDDCEPVEVEFSWAQYGAASEVTAADCVCSHELCARLVHMLYAGVEETPAASAPLTRNVAVAAAHHEV